MTEKHENLLAAYFVDRITDDEKAEIVTLLKTDKEFADAFREMEEAYVASCIPAFEKTKDEDFKLLESRIQPGRKVFSFWKPIAVAASIAAIVCFGAALYSGHKFQDAERFISGSEVTTIATTRGTGTQALLPDGTHVSLNAGSSISFDRSFGRKERNVNLEGEGYFEVAADADKPFRVHTGNTCVTVKGTVFNVRSYSDEAEISVSLLEGSVLLTAPTGEVMLKPGNCAVVSRRDGRIRMEEAAQSVSGWTRGKIVFTDKSIPEILNMVQRNYGVQFVYEDGLFGNELFTGSISTSLSIDEILSYLDIDHKYTWTRKDDTIEIYKK